MRYAIELAPEAVRDLRELRADLRAMGRDAIERYLRHQPQRTSKGRIKRLRGLTRPQFRLRVGDLRAFYDVGEGTVEVLAVVLKAEAEARLKGAGDRP